MKWENISVNLTEEQKDYLMNIKEESGIPMAVQIRQMITDKMNGIVRTIPQYGMSVGSRKKVKTREIVDKAKKEVEENKKKKGKMSREAEFYSLTSEIKEKLRSSDGGFPKPSTFVS